jgi:DNA polymerase-3 subunit gamma/tau
MRDALSLLDQVMTYCQEGVTDQDVLESLGAIDQEVLSRFSAVLFKGETITALDMLDGLYNQGQDLRQVHTKLLEHFRNLLVVKMGYPDTAMVDIHQDDLDNMKTQLETVSLETVHHMFTLLFEAEATIKFSSQPKIALEAVLIKLSTSRQISSVEQIIGKLDNVAKALGGEGPPPSDPVERQEPQEDTPVPEATAPTETGTNPQGSLKQIWQDLLAAIGRNNKPLLPCLEKAELARVGEDFLELAVQQNSFFAGRLKDKRTLDAVQGICRSFFKRDMEIRLLEKGDAYQETKNRVEDRKGHQLKRDALNHPIVTDALEIFNGKVIDVKIL